MRVEREDGRALVSQRETFDVAPEYVVELCDALFKGGCVVRRGGEERGGREVQRGDGEEEVGAAEALAVCVFLRRDGLSTDPPRKCRMFREWTHHSIEVRSELFVPEDCPVVLVLPNKLPPFAG